MGRRLELSPAGMELPRERSRTMRGRKGFTLVELLTVISIISLLMAILLPVLHRAKRNARAGVCQSNLRQWGIVFKMYTDEHDGLLVRTKSEPAWYYPVREYYSNMDELLICPSATKPSNPGGSAEPPYGRQLRPEPLGLHVQQAGGNRKRPVVGRRLVLL